MHAVTNIQQFPTVTMAITITITITICCHVTITNVRQLFIIFLVMKESENPVKLKSYISTLLALLENRPAERAEAVCTTYEDGVVAEVGVNSQKISALGGAPEGGGGDDGEDEDMFIG